MQGLPCCTRALLPACVLCFPASHAWGSRPFVSTDAAVVDPKEVGIALGSCTLERTQGEHTFTMPSLVVHDGLLTTIALVGELRVQESPTQLATDARLIVGSEASAAASTGDQKQTQTPKN